MTVKTTLKTTTHTECGKADQVAPNVARTTERLSTRQQVSKKALNPTSAKVSGQLAKIKFTKYQQVYSSVGIEALRLSGQSDAGDGERDYNLEKRRFRPPEEP